MCVSLIFLLSHSPVWLLLFWYSSPLYYNSIRLSVRICALSVYITARSRCLVRKGNFFGVKKENGTLMTIRKKVKEKKLSLSLLFSVYHRSLYVHIQF